MSHSAVRLLLVFSLTGSSLHAQRPVAEPHDASRQLADLSRRVDARVRSLTDEASQLVGRSASLLSELPTLETELERETRRSQDAQAAVRDATADLEATANRLAALEQRRVGELPGLHAGLVELYKQGRGGYARMLLNTKDLKEMTRAIRTVAGLTRINQDRAEAHRRTLDALAAERATLEQRRADLQAAETEVAAARRAAQRAVDSRASLLADVDRRRDRNAELLGELHLAQQQLATAMADIEAGRTAQPVSVPITAFREALAWPVAGEVTTRFGESQDDRDVATPRAGIEIAGPEDAPVLPVYEGTVTFADVFEGYGTLVIVDHGDNHYSLYGDLGSALVRPAQRLAAGEPLGTVGPTPAGPSTVYFELRIDGHAVDPLEWLQAR